MFTKQIATIFGVSFTVLLFIVFTVSERLNAKARRETKQGLEQFNLDVQAEISVGVGAIHARPGCILVAVRDYNRMSHLHSVLQKTNLRRHDIVVMTVRGVSAGAGEYDLSDNQLFTDYERELFMDTGQDGVHTRLLQSVWGPDYGDEVEYLRVFVNQLRKKIEKNPSTPKYIFTEPWVGYRFHLPDNQKPL